MKNELGIIINTVLENNGLDKVNELGASSHLRNDLGLDSINLAELTVRIEEKFGVDVFQGGIVNTVGEIVQIIKKNYFMLMNCKIFI